jgi:general secretion pathway protein C
LALLCAVLLLRLLAGAAAAPSPPAMPAFSPPALPDPALLAGRDLFFGAGTAAGDRLPVTALPFSLHGLRTDSVTGRGGAIIAGPDGTQASYQVGEDLGDGVTLVAIAIDHVVLERDGQREALWLDSGGDSPVQYFDPGPAMAAPAVTGSAGAGASSALADIETDEMAAEMDAVPDREGN